MSIHIPTTSVRRVGSRDLRFDQFRALQQQLLTSLSLGHVCKADCIWLHYFIKNYFPRIRFFGDNRRHVAISRISELSKWIQTLRIFLLHAQNYTCFEHPRERYAIFESIYSQIFQYS